VEEWYYSWVAGGFDGLVPKQRSDAGRSRVIKPEVGELILRLKAEKPRRSVRRIIRALERDRKVAKGELKKSTVHRFLKRHGMSGRPRRAYEERRAFRHPWAGDLWMGDVMHGPKVIAPDGKVRKSYLHLLVDSATRFVPGSTFRLGETAVDLQAVLKEAILKYGLPRVLYLDLGAAQRADSLRLICAELGIRLLHCRPYDPEAKAGVERFIRTFREEVLDEIGELPPQAQVRLLRVLQSKEIERVGGVDTIPLDIRIIAATNRDLEKMVKEKNFREDLWFRLNVFPLWIPPLRERQMDIPALIQHFINLKSSELKLAAVPTLYPGAIDSLMTYHWPGNVRELENVIERELILNPKGPLTFGHLETAPAQATHKTNYGSTEGKRLDDVVSLHIRRILAEAKGKINGPDGAAAMLGMNPSTLRNRMKKLGVAYGRNASK
jgi:transposase InsO family protein